MQVEDFLSLLVENKGPVNFNNQANSINAVEKTETFLIRMGVDASFFIQCIKLEELFLVLKRAACLSELYTLSNISHALLMMLLSKATLSEKKLLSRTLKSPSGHRSAGTLKVLSKTLYKMFQVEPIPEVPYIVLAKNMFL